MFKLLKELNAATNYQIPSGNVLKFKFIIGKHFNELKQKHLSTLEQKFKYKSIVILIAANNGKEYHVYWKSKDIAQFLTLKSFNKSLTDNDTFLFEYVAEFLAKSLKSGHLGM